MAVSRGIWIVLGLIIAAVAISATGLVVMALFVGRVPQISGNSTLVLKVGGDLQEMEPGGVIGQFFEAPPTVRGVVEALRKAKVDSRVTSVVIRPTSAAALWGKVQEVRDAITDFRRSGKPIVGVSRIRRRAGVLPGERVRQGVPAADRHARSDRHRELRAVPARHARQDRRVSRHAPHRRVQDRRRTRSPSTPSRRRTARWRCR